MEGFFQVRLWCLPLQQLPGKIFNIILIFSRMVVFLLKPEIIVVFLVKCLSLVMPALFIHCPLKILKLTVSSS